MPRNGPIGDEFFVQATDTTAGFSPSISYYLSTTNPCIDNNISGNILPRTFQFNSIINGVQVWFMKISNEGKIEFNFKDYPNLTIDEMTKKFLESLQSITHVDKGQFTFSF